MTEDREWRWKKERQKTRPWKNERIELTEEDGRSNDGGSKGRSQENDERIEEERRKMKEEEIWKRRWKTKSPRMATKDQRNKQKRR